MTLAIPVTLRSLPWVTAGWTYPFARMHASRRVSPGLSRFALFIPWVEAEVLLKPRDRVHVAQLGGRVLFAKSPASHHASSPL